MFWKVYRKLILAGQLIAILASASCAQHDYNVSECIDTNILTQEYGDLIETTFSQSREIHPIEYPEISYFTHERTHLSLDEERRYRRIGHLANEDYPENLDYFLAGGARTMLFEHYTLPRGSDDGFFKGGKKGTRLHRKGILRGFRTFGTRKYDMLMWQIVRKTDEREYEKVEVIFHYPQLLQRINCKEDN